MQRSVLAILALAGFAAFAPQLRAEGPGQVELPNVNTNPRADIYVNVSVGGGPPVAVIFDTGSTGLRIYAPAVGPSVKRTGIPIHYGYGSGSAYYGEKAYANVKIGPVATATAVPFELVTDLHCYANQPNCPGKIGVDAAARQWRIRGVMGVSLAGGGGIPSPLSALPAPLNGGFVISHRQVFLGPPESVERTFKTLQLARLSPDLANGGPAWNTTLQVSWRVGGSAANGGAPIATLFDTGNEEATIRVAAGDVASTLMAGEHLRNGVPVEATIPGVLDWRFPSGSQSGVNQVRVALPTHGRPHVNPGWAAFDWYDVMYDAQRGLIGFRPAR
jgi:hypothetical protein